MTANFHSHYPSSGKAETSFAAYFQNMLNWMAGYRHLSGMLIARASASSLTVPSGTYMAGTPTTVTYAGINLTGISACGEGLHRYDLIYFETSDGTTKIIPGMPVTPTNVTHFLENLAPQPGDLPSETSFLLAVICVDVNGIRSTDNNDSVAGVADMRFTAPIGSILLSYLSAASQAQGDLIMRGASAWVRFPTAAMGNYLQSRGGSADLLWSNLLISSLYDAAQARGHLIMCGATVWGSKAPGSANKYLMSNGSGVDLSYEDLLIESLYDASEAQGCLPVRKSTTWGVLAPGTTNYVLTSQGTGADLIWSKAATSGDFLVTQVFM